jgi:hypothetical protein
MGDGLLAAIRRFPEYRTEIEQMGARDEDFRLLCEDFAEAESALSLWEKSTSPHRSQRMVEYNGLLTSLAEELRNALNSSSVVRFSRDRR